MERDCAINLVVIIEKVDKKLKKLKMFQIIEALN